MLSWITNVFSRTVYVQIWEERIKIALIGSSRIYDERPYIAIVRKSGEKAIVKAVGNEAYALLGMSDLDITNPFSHPRLLVSDFQKAEKVLQHAFQQIFDAKLFQPSPVVVMHPREKLEGGITDVECRLFRELALGAGAREVRLHIGDELSTVGWRLENVKEPGAI